MWGLRFVGLLSCCCCLTSQQERAGPRAVSVKCGEDLLLVMANRDFFGTNRLVSASELRLGAAGCNVSRLEQEGQAVVFEYGLHECGSTVQMTPHELVYTTHLYYVPTVTGIIVRTNPVTVTIKCRYPRVQNVSSDAVKPTWVSYNSTKRTEQHLAFTLRLMNDDWSRERTSNVYILGDLLHIEAAVETSNVLPLRLYIDRCVATPTALKTTDVKYSVIDYNGCLLDSKAEGTASSFLMSRLEMNRLQFTLDTFKFYKDERNMIYLHCDLKVSTVDQLPNELNKACSFEKASAKWIPVDGTEDICNCCDSGTCGFLSRRGETRRWRMTPRQSEWEGSSVLGPLIVQDYVDQKPVMALSLDDSYHMDIHDAVEHLPEGADNMVMVLSLSITGSVICFALIGFVLYKKLYH
uniref:Zona pellucida sperm-binding protein 3 n=1 Tax=Callorhinchus milii TaxID=7868 RepID=V9KVT3_CALMI